jgi:NADPH:quinone reductase-like Zn-dependent oxidoreductase
VVACVCADELIDDDESEQVPMRVAGIRQISGPVESFELPEPRALASDEVLIEVRAAGVGNWDEIARTGGWDLGITPPMALGVEAAGSVVAVGDAVTGVGPGDDVLTHPLPLREQGAWAEKLIAPAECVARKPSSVAWDVAGAFAVPALTAEQVLSEAVRLRAGERLLVHGGGGVTGGMMVELATLRGAFVITTAGASSSARVRDRGAHEVVDYRDEDWPEAVLRLTGGQGVNAAVNLVRNGAVDALRSVTAGGRLATITSDPPPPERGIAISTVYVRADGRQLAALVDLLGAGRLTLPVGTTYPLSQAAAALAAVGGSAGRAVVMVP